MGVERNVDAGATVKGQKNVASKVQAQIEKNLSGSAKRDPAWDALKNEPQLLVWRIEDFKVVPVEQQNFGSFYDGDSYIVLHSYFNKSQKLCYDAYIWIGRHSTADEYGTAAYKMAELDIDVLKDAAIQHREVQSNESSKFINVFPVFSVIKGGIKSGFKRGEKEKEPPKLLHISGEKKTVIVKEVSYRKDNLTDDDVYIAVVDDNAYQINGKTSNKDERFRAAEVMNHIKSRNGKLKVEVIDNYTSSTKHPAIDAMPVKGKKNIDAAAATNRNKSIWMVSDRTGKMEMTKVKEGSLPKSELKSDEVMIIDTGDTIYVWIGKGANHQERMLSMSYGQKYTDNINQPHATLRKVSEGNEPEELLAVLN